MYVINVVWHKYVINGLDRIGLESRAIIKPKGNTWRSPDQEHWKSEETSSSSGAAGGCSSSRFGIIAPSNGARDMGGLAIHYQRNYYLCLVSSDTEPWWEHKATRLSREIMQNMPVCWFAFTWSMYISNLLNIQCKKKGLLNWKEGESSICASLVGISEESNIRSLICDYY